MEKEQLTNTASISTLEFDTFNCIVNEFLDSLWNYIYNNDEERIQSVQNSGKHILEFLEKAIVETEAFLNKIISELFNDIQRIVKSIKNLLLQKKKKQKNKLVLKYNEFKNLLSTFDIASWDLFEEHCEQANLNILALMKEIEPTKPLSKNERIKGKIGIDNEFENDAKEDNKIDDKDKIKIESYKKHNFNMG